MRLNFALTPEQKADARAALGILEGTGITLEEAAKRAVVGARAARRVTLADAIDQFVRTRLKGGRRRATVEWYEDRLARLNASMGNRIMDTIGKGELRAEIGRLHPTASAGSATVRACRALWRWAMQQEQPMAAIDATEGLEARVTARGGRSPTILTVDQCQTMLAGAGRHTSALALMLFAGIRPYEVAGPGKPRLLWQHVNPVERLIRIPSEINKTGRKRSAARIIEGLPDTVWAWLMPGDKGRPVAEASARRVVNAAAGRIGYGNERHGGHRPWPQDCLRHTFATYALAYTGDAGKVAYWLGHEGNPRMLYNHYRGLATKAEAEAFFALRPSTS